MKILVACEFSGIVRDAFAAKGHDAWSCDLLPTERPGHHIQGDALEAIHSQPWDMLIAHPPCTYLCRAGWNWVNKPDSSTLPLKGEPRRKAARDATEFFMAMLHSNVKRIAVENPRPICHVNLPAPNQTIQPWEFGEPETKCTCLWLKNLPPLMATIIETKRTPRLHHLPPSPDRSKERSRTYRGIAAAMANQWGSL